MRTPFRFIALLALALLAGCTAGEVLVNSGDCDACEDDATADDDATSDDDTSAPADDDSTPTDADDDSVPVDDDDADLRVTITTPGGSVYGSMICHIEYITDGDGDGSLTDEFVGWEYPWVENWVSETTLELNPGVIDAIRLNCTLCPGELTLAQEPSSPEAEGMGCTWTAVNGSSSTNGTVATWYFGETFSSSLVAVGTGTSVLVDLR